MTRFQPNKQRGVVLVVGLIMLLLLTIIGLSGARDAALQERMSGNMRDLQLAFQAAEAGLRSGEMFVVSSASLSPGSNGVVESNVLGGTRDYWSSDCAGAECFDWLANGVQPSSSQYLEGIDSQPYYAIEPLELTKVAAGGEENAAAQIEKYEFFRVTARGVGNTGKTEVIVQSIVKKM